MEIFMNLVVAVATIGFVLVILFLLFNMKIELHGGSNTNVYIDNVYIDNRQVILNDASVKEPVLPDTSKQLLLR